MTSRSAFRTGSATSSGRSSDLIEVLIDERLDLTVHIQRLGRLRRNQVTCMRHTFVNMEIRNDPGIPELAVSRLPESYRKSLDCRF